MMCYLFLKLRQHLLVQPAGSVEPFPPFLVKEKVEPKVQGDFDAVAELC
jgi:hypothetical protein